MATPFLVWQTGAVPPALTLGQVLAIGVGVTCFPLWRWAARVAFCVIRRRTGSSADRRLAVRWAALGPVEAVTALFTFGGAVGQRLAVGQSPAPLLLAQASGAARSPPSCWSGRGCFGVPQ